MNEKIEISNNEQREELKNRMVVLRENGMYEEAIQGFEQVIEWDRSNNNPKGEFDVMGHERIAYTNWASDTPEPVLKLERLEKANQIQQSILDLMEREFPEDKARRALGYVHFADVLLELIKLQTSQNIDAHKLIEQATSALDYALENLGGSQAHKSFVHNKKAQVLYETGDVAGALVEIQKGESAIFNGYSEEIKEVDGVMKIRVWQTGLWLTYAHICSKEGRPEIGRLLAEAVLSVQDTSGTLATRKKQARRLLDELGIEG